MISVLHFGSSPPDAQVRDSYAGSMRQGWFFESEILETKDNGQFGKEEASPTMTMTVLDYTTEALVFHSFSPLVFWAVAADALPLAVFSGLACFEPSKIKVSRFPQTLWLL